MTLAWYTKTKPLSTIADKGFVKSEVGSLKSKVCFNSGLKALDSGLDITSYHPYRRHPLEDDQRLLLQDRQPIRTPLLTT